MTLTDLFAGAGGSSTGAIQVPGVEVRLAANHWQRAGKNNNELDGKLSAVRGAPTPDRSKPGKEAQQ